MNKNEVIKQYGKERCQVMHEYLDKLNRYYAFPYLEENLYGFLEDLGKFEKEDLMGSLSILEDRESSFPIKFNEIKNACKDSRSIRRKYKEMKEGRNQKENTGIPMPEKMKEMLSRLEKQFTSNDPTSTDRK